MRFLMILVSLCVPVYANAAEFRVIAPYFSSKWPIPHLQMSGTIDVGDVEKLETALARLPCSSSFCDSEPSSEIRAFISLNSPGGVAQTGMELADYFRGNNIATIVESGDECISACALAFLGGSGFKSTGGIGRYFDRTFEPGAMLAFHAPSLPNNTISEIESGDLAQQAIDVTRTSITNLVRHLSRYQVDQQMIIAVLSRVGSSELIFVDNAEDMFYFGVRLPDFSPKLMGLDEQQVITNACKYLLAEYYGIPPSETTNAMVGELQQKSLGEDQSTIGYSVDDRRLDISFCGMQDGNFGYRFTLYRSSLDGLVAFKFMNLSTDEGFYSFGARPSTAMLDRSSTAVLGTLNNMMLDPELKISDLPSVVTQALNSSRFRHAAEYRFPRMGIRFESTEITRNYRISSRNLVAVYEQVGTSKLFHRVLSIHEQNADTDETYRADFENAFVRTGYYRNGDGAYYLLGLLDGLRSAVIQIDVDTSGGRTLSEREQQLISDIACSTSFGQASLPCAQ